jgi:hypothetical protein
MSSAADASDDQQSAQESLIERQMPVWEQRVLLCAAGGRNDSSRVRRDPEGGLLRFPLHHHASSRT